MVKKRLFFWILLVVSVVCMIVGFGAKAKITDWPMCFILFGIPMFLTAVFRLCCFDEVERCFSKSTTLVTLGISAFGGSGLLFGFCMLVIVGFAGSDRHPIAGPVDGLSDTGAHIQGGIQGRGSLLKRRGRPCAPIAAEGRGGVTFL